MKHIVLMLFIILIFSIITEQYFYLIINKHTETEINASNKIDHPNFHEHNTIQDIVLNVQNKSNQIVKHLINKSAFKLIIYTKKYNSFVWQPPEKVYSLKFVV